MNFKKVYSQYGKKLNQWKQFQYINIEQNYSTENFFVLSTSKVKSCLELDGWYMGDSS